MWGESKLELKDDVRMERGSNGSELVIMDDRIMEVAARVQPPVNNITVSKSTKVHIGPKFVSVTQNVDNSEVVKGRILGLELVSPQNAKRLRCSIAVFVCWAFVVATTLLFFIIYFALAKKEMRLNLDLPFHRYVWDVAKNTTKAERLSCVAALLVLIVCIVLIMYFILISKKDDDVVDVAPHEWFITRDDWLTPIPFNLSETNDAFRPLRLVVIAHTVSGECHIFKNCAAYLRNLQNYYHRSERYGYDLPYSFLIGNEGRVYEGRGWKVVGAHSAGYNNCTMSLAFIGDYREGLSSYSTVTDLQLERAQMLFRQGVELGYLHPDFEVLGAKDLFTTLSPGTNIYNKIREWPNYAHDNVFKDRTCEEVRDFFNSENYTEATTTVDDDDSQ